VVTKGVVDTNNIDSVRAIVERRTLRKAAWAAREVQALQRLERERNLDIMTLRGSWAGAMGWPQFLPSSLLQWGADGNGDKRVDLNVMQDAAASVARYLHEHGWGTTTASQRAAVFAYNNSNDYVTAVLTLARKAAPLRTKKKR
jgi:membrane-bound lytic murein transglycosylase B